MSADKSLESLDPFPVIADHCCVKNEDEDYREWLRLAIGRLNAETARTADTHLLKLQIPKFAGVDLYLKDESTHPTGSLKHRLARSLFLYGLCNGDIRKDTVIVEASSGSTAISEAYFAQLLSLRFVAVVPKHVSSAKVREIEAYGGEIAYVAGPDIYGEAERIARQLDGHYMDQFTFAERVTDWRGNNNIAESIFAQMAHEPHSDPAWIVVGAGTGGTSATIGRYIRYGADQRKDTKLCVADPEGSVFIEGFMQEEAPEQVPASRLEGVGRPRLEPSFVPGVVDRMMRLPDAASIAGAHWLSERLGRRVGGSTGLTIYTALKLAGEMVVEGREGSIVTLICDSGTRYDDTIYDENWLTREGLDIEPWLARLRLLDA